MANIWDFHITKSHRLQIATGILILTVAGRGSTYFLALAGVMLIAIIFSLVIESKDILRRAESELPPLLEQIKGISKDVYLQSPDAVRTPIENGLANNIRKLEEIAVKLQSEAHDPNIGDIRKEQAAIKFATLLKDIAEAHTKFTDLTGRVLPSQVLQGQASPASPNADPAPAA